MTVTEKAKVNLISFTIDITTYYAGEGMTWAEWVQSSYNIIGAYSNGTFIFSLEEKTLYKEPLTIVFARYSIEAGCAYKFMSASETFE